MKRIFSLCLVGTMFLISYAVAETPALSRAQSGRGANSSPTLMPGSTDSGQMVVASDKALMTHEKGVTDKEAKTSVQPDSQLDSLTMQMVEETTAEMSKQAKASAEKSIREFIEKNSTRSYGSADTLNAVRPGKTTF